MMIHNLRDCFKGWFISSFENAKFKADFEVAIKRYSRGDYENSHFHKEAVEVTVIVDGIVLMNGREYHKDDIIIIEKNESTDFRCLTDVTTCVVKSKSVDGDKYIS